MNLPKARTENLVEQNLKNETLIYDLTTHQAFNLNETLSIVYKACDGTSTFDELKRRHKFTDDFISLALNELKENNLLVENTAYVSPFSNTSRREVIKKVGLATMFVLPLIAGLAAPTAAQAASGAAGGGGSNNNTAGITGGPCYSTGFCAADYNCHPTAQICCLGINSGSVPILPGETVVLDDSRYIVSYDLPDVPPAYEPCSMYTRCCYGDTPTGTCTYQPTGETDPPIVYYYQTCTCSCPAH